MVKKESLDNLGKVLFELNSQMKNSYSYTEMMNDARALATKRMVQEAEELCTDPVVNIRYPSAAAMQGAAEVIVYCFRADISW